jgi:hypothetical protein
VPGSPEQHAAIAAARRTQARRREREAANLTTMRQRGMYVIVGALGLAALAGLSGCGRAGSSHGAMTRATAVSATITVNPQNDETAMTAEQAWANMDNTSIAPGTTVQLGLLTVPVGPDCGAECENGNIVQNGMVYSTLNQLVYGYSWSNCPADSSLPASQCTEWIFLDANTGKMVNGLIPQGSSGVDTKSPSAG